MFVDIRKNSAFGDGDFGVSRIQWIIRKQSAIRPYLVHQKVSVGSGLLQGIFNLFRLAVQGEDKMVGIGPRLSEAKKSTRAVFFVNATHFVLAPFLGFLWTFVRVFIKAPADRQRFNVLAALKCHHARSGDSYE